MKAIIISLLCAMVLTLHAQPQKTMYGQDDMSVYRVDMSNAELCHKGGVYYLREARKVPTREQAEQALKESIVLLEHALKLRQANPSCSLELVTESRVSLIEAYMTIGQLRLHRSPDATDYFRHAERHAELLLKENEKVTGANRKLVARHAYILMQLQFMLGDSKGGVASGELAWRHGWRDWDELIVQRLYDVMGRENITPKFLPPPRREPTSSSKAWFPLNVVPDMVVEIVMRTGKHLGCTGRVLFSKQYYWSAPLLLALPVSPVAGMWGGVSESWRGYSFWETKSMRQLRDQEIPDRAFKLWPEW